MIQTNQKLAFNLDLIKQSILFIQAPIIEILTYPDDPKICAVDALLACI